MVPRFRRELETTPLGEGEATWLSDPSRRPDTIENTWSAPAAGSGLGFVSTPLDRTAVVGPISADLWLSSTAPDTDIQVTISEVRPDGSEMLVTTGVQRASQRAIDPVVDSVLEPGHTFLDPTPLAGGPELVRVQVLPVGHAFRPGSRIRVTAGPVGGNRDVWRYDSVDSAAPPTSTLHFGPSAASSIVLPLIDGVAVPAGVPACPQAGQPCRAYVPATNGG